MRSVHGGGFYTQAPHRGPNRMGGEERAGA